MFLCSNQQPSRSSRRKKAKRKWLREQARKKEVTFGRIVTVQVTHRATSVSMCAQSVHAKMPKNISNLNDNIVTCYVSDACFHDCVIYVRNCFDLHVT